MVIDELMDEVLDVIPLVSIYACEFARPKGIDSLVTSFGVGKLSGYPPVGSHDTSPRPNQTTAEEEAASQILHRICPSKTPSIIVDSAVRHGATDYIKSRCANHRTEDGRGCDWETDYRMHQAR